MLSVVAVSAARSLAVYSASFLKAAKGQTPSHLEIYQVPWFYADPPRDARAIASSSRGLQWKAIMYCSMAFYDCVTCLTLGSIWDNFPLVETCPVTR